MPAVKAKCAPRGKPFAKGNPGKPKGAIHRSTKAVKDVFAEVFTKLQEDPKAKLIVWAKQNPTDFYKLATRLIPVQVANDPDNPVPGAMIDLRNYTDEELRTLAELQRKGRAGETQHD